MANRMFDINGDQRPDLLWWWLDYDQWSQPSTPDIPSPWLLGPEHLAHWISSPTGYDWSYTGPVG